ncbi:ATP-binding protein [Castellaniella sp.]|uniref:ATP-binding protein n=1 Tax=Castellaniella sp. TaxID=1955812 RepID=UPI002AFE62FF|nr:ATP-binding protein [Castellaniella sp.]
MSDSRDMLELHADAQAVPHALEWLEAIAEQQEWPPRTTFGLTLCLDEALTNVVSYAFDPQATDDSPAITVSCQVREGAITLTLRDNGRPYDPTAGDPPALVACLDEAKPGGHGVRLMRHYLHELRYQRQSGWNCLTMVMHHP